MQNTHTKLLQAEDHRTLEVKVKGIETNAVLLNVLVPSFPFEIITKNTVPKIVFQGAL